MHSMNISNFDLNLLRVFDAMMAERNVTRAAQRVFLSQPAVSHALARLRKEIGDPLFVRAGREMIPTAKATELGPAVHTMLDQLALVVGKTRFDPRTSAAVFRIGIVDVREYLLAPLFAKLMREEGSRVRLLVHGFDDANFQAQLASGALDIAVSMPQPPAPGIHSRKLSTQGKCLASQSHCGLTASGDQRTGYWKKRELEERWSMRRRTFSPYRPFSQIATCYL
ncbi:MAG: hypothetical protein DMG76_28405 [Acidobacteria bacterium]|nr:MAG: hypothetical protein DMG76_28405 [Acidobacteriota bacterium]